MTRVVVFIAVLLGIVLVMNLGEYKHVAVQNEKFNLQVAEQEHMAKEKEIEALTAPKEMVHVKTEKKKEGPLVVLSTEELKRGAKLFGKCQVCHGKAGEGKKSQKAPRIGGQFTWYIETQLNAFKNKTRINKVMDPYIKGLSTQDFKDLAEYISKLPW